MHTRQTPASNESAQNDESTSSLLPDLLTDDPFAKGQAAVDARASELAAELAGVARPECDAWIARKIAEMQVIIEILVEDAEPEGRA